MQIIGFLSPLNLANPLWFVHSYLLPSIQWKYPKQAILQNPKINASEVDLFWLVFAALSQHLTDNESLTHLGKLFFWAPRNVNLLQRIFFTSSYSLLPFG